MMSVVSSAIQKNQKQSINAKKLPQKQNNCVSMQNVVNFVVKSFFSQKFGEWRLQNPILFFSQFSYCEFAYTKFEMMMMRQGNPRCFDQVFHEII
jgi:hypothetical protein